MNTETIAAIATGLTPSGIGIIRISGEDALMIAQKVFDSNKLKDPRDTKDHMIYYGHVKDETGVLDECLLSVMLAPRTYTGEDTVEINCHGGILVMRKVLDAVIHAGARPALPGEFTKRAFLNGKMDLAQAEAVIDTIEAKNEYALRSSEGQLSGSMTKQITKLREAILYETAFIESALDDPEHISLEGYPEKLSAVVDELTDSARRLLDTADKGKLIREGIRTVILGKPNVGKSSLLNLLLGEERAIVTDIAGTTRDALEETIMLGGISLNMTDTAGIRQTDNMVEQIGVERSVAYAKRADLVLYVVDTSVPLDENDRKIIRMIADKKVIVLLNKSDLESCVSEADIRALIDAPVLAVSAKEKTGLEALRSLIEQMFFSGEVSFNEEVYLTNVRHKAAVEDALDSLKMVKNSIESGMPEDFFSIDLTNAYEALGRITGETTGEDVVNEIFSKFCTGK